MQWDNYFLKLAKLVSQKSKDRSTKVGYVLVGEDNEILSTGFNGFPRGIDDDVESRHERPAKYAWTEHAERNAVYNAARIGVSLKGARAYSSSEGLPCVECARALIQAGIVEIIGDKNDKWQGKGNHYNFETSREMLLEAGIVLRDI